MSILQQHTNDGEKIKTNSNDYNYSTTNKEQ